MENQIPEISPVNNPQAPIVQPIETKTPTYNFLIILLSSLLIISCLIAGFFAYQTQKLVNELNKNQIALVTPTPVATVEPTIEPTATSSAIIDTSNWKTYTNTKYSYLIKYPQNWLLTNLTDGNQIEVYYQLDKTKSVGEVLIENLNQTVYENSIKTASQEKIIGGVIAKCNDNSTTKTWCYLNNNGKYLSILKTLDKDSEYNKTLDTILSTFKFTN